MSTLREYSKRIPDFNSIARQPSALVLFFAYFLDRESTGEPATSKALAPMFEEMRVRQPANLSDVLRKSKFFVRAKEGGYRLSHEGEQRVISALTPLDSPVSANGTNGSLQIRVTPSHAEAEHASSSRNSTLGTGLSKNVLVVYGRDHALRRDLFSFLRALGLNPLEFEEMAHLTGSTSPFTWEVIETAFKNVQACVVLLSPDESVTLRAGLREQHDSSTEEYQPRPNVLIEAGMALALQPTRTILVRVGRLRHLSDLDGKQYVNLDGSAESRNKLLGKLKLAQCDVKSHGDDWLKVGNFKSSAETGN